MLDRCVIPLAQLRIAKVIAHVQQKRRSHRLTAQFSTDHPVRTTRLTSGLERALRIPLIRQLAGALMWVSS